MRRFGAVAATWLATTLVGVAQQPGKTGPTVAELTKDLATISAGDAESVGDLAEETARKLVAFLSAQELSATELAEMDLAASAVEPKDAAQLTVYTFGYSSGGTRGTVHCPILQWKNAAGKLFAYRLHEECDFDRLYKLVSPGRNLYLLLGQEQGDLNSTQSEAYVVELKGNYLRLDNVAFGSGPLLSISNVAMSFDGKKQVLTLDLTDHDASAEDNKILARWGYRGKFPARPMTLFRRTYPPPESRSTTAQKVLVLKFNGQRFVKN